MRHHAHSPGRSPKLLLRPIGHRPKYASSHPAAARELTVAASSGSDRHGVPAPGLQATFNCRLYLIDADIKDAMGLGLVTAFCTTRQMVRGSNKTMFYAPRSESFGRVAMRGRAGGSIARDLNYRSAHSRSQVHRPGIVAHIEVTATKQRRRLAPGCTTYRIEDSAPAHRHHFLGQRHFFCRADEDSLTADHTRQPRAHFRKAGCRPSTRRCRA